MFLHYPVVMIVQTTMGLMKALCSNIFYSINASVIAEHLITRKQAIRFCVNSPFLGQLVTMDSKISAVTHCWLSHPRLCVSRCRFDRPALWEKLPCRNPSWRETREALTSARGRPGKTNSHFNSPANSCCPTNRQLGASATSNAQEKERGR